MTRAGSAMLADARDKSMKSRRHSDRLFQWVEEWIDGWEDGGRGKREGRRLSSVIRCWVHSLGRGCENLTSTLKVEKIWAHLIMSVARIWNKTQQHLPTFIPISGSTLCTEPAASELLKEGRRFPHNIPLTNDVSRWLLLSVRWTANGVKIATLCCGLVCKPFLFFLSFAAW